MAMHHLLLLQAKTWGVCSSGTPECERDHCEKRMMKDRCYLPCQSTFTADPIVVVMHRLRRRIHDLEQQLAFMQQQQQQQQQHQEHNDEDREVGLPCLCEREQVEPSVVTPTITMTIPSVAVQPVPTATLIIATSKPTSTMRAEDDEHGDNTAQLPEPLASLPLDSSAGASGAGSLSSVFNSTLGRRSDLSGATFTLVVALVTIPVAIVLGVLLLYRQRGARRGRLHRQYHRHHR